MKTVAPAKINWTLEVLGRREDGYHEIRSVLQTIDLCDEVEVESSLWLRFKNSQGRSLAQNDLVARATRLLAQRAGIRPAVKITLTKRIPRSAGFGGGSSDAAATLRLLNEYWKVGLTLGELATLGATLGSDVPFFLHGGTALIEGRGERVTPLPDAQQVWMVMISPPVRELPNKTASMYGELRNGDFTNGAYTEAFVSVLKQGTPPNEADMLAYKQLLADGIPSESLPPSNAFSRHAYPHPGVEAALLKAIPSALEVAGSGPGLFAVVPSNEEAAEAARRVREEMGVKGGSVFVARTLGATEATAVTD